jgi:hypothetical protein
MRIQTYSFLEKALMRKEKNPCTGGRGGALTSQEMVVDIRTAYYDDTGEKHRCLEGHWGGANESLRVRIG